MLVEVGDTLVMKKPHPCGETHFTVLRVGMDFKLRCAGCGHEIMAPRAKIERGIRRVEHSEPRSGHTDTTGE